MRGRRFIPADEMPIKIRTLFSSALRRDDNTMHSLEAIPEPTNNAPPTEVDDATHVPMHAIVEQPTGRPGMASKSNEINEDADQQVDNLAVLLVLLIAGALLRVVLGLLGPLQGIDPARVEHAQNNGRQLLAGDLADAFPLVDLLAFGLGSAGIPAWALVAIGSLLTLAAVPAAYVIGRTLTGRAIAGVVAAAVLAVHPAVLTAANSYTPTAIALGLVTLGLAMLCFIDKRGALAAIGGGVLLGLAGLAAPLCWLIGALAGPLAYKLSLRLGAYKAFSLGLLVTLLAVAPATAFRTVYLGNDASSAFVEWAPQQDTHHSQPTPLDQLLVTMTSPSFQSLGEAMHLPLGDAGQLRIAYTPKPKEQAERDVVADTLADGWLLINAALAGLAMISAGVMLARRRFIETLLLTAPLAAFAFTTLPPTEALRLPMIVLVGVLATGLLATRSIPILSEEERQARHLAKLAKQEAKERIKQERELKKHKESLHAFDEQTKPKRKAKPEQQPAMPQAILTEHAEDAPPLGARVI